MSISQQAQKAVAARVEFILSNNDNGLLRTVVQPVQDLGLKPATLKRLVEYIPPFRYVGDLMITTDPDLFLIPRLGPTKLSEIRRLALSSQAIPGWPARSDLDHVVIIARLRQRLDEVANDPKIEDLNSEPVSTAPGCAGMPLRQPDRPFDLTTARGRLAARRLPRNLRSFVLGS